MLSTITELLNEAVALFSSLCIKGFFWTGNQADDQNCFQNVLLSKDYSACVKYDWGFREFT